MEEHFLKKSHKSITGPSRAEHDEGQNLQIQGNHTHTHPKSFKMREKNKKVTLKE